MGWLFSNDQLSAGAKLFADQFEPHGQDFLYRKSSKGPPIPVSAAEKEGFVKAFNKSQKVTIFFTVALILICVVVLVTVYPDEQGEPEWVMAALIGMTVIGICAATGWNWNAPTRALRGRGTVGQARTVAEARALALSQMSYGQLATAAGAGLVLLLKIGAKHDPLSGWNRLWLAGVALLIGVAAFQAYRKWRFERSRAGS